MSRLRELFFRLGQEVGKPPDTGGISYMISLI